MKTIDELGISPMPWESHKQFVIANDDGSVVAATNVRDARLIAAAPDCYDALQRIVSATEGAVADFPKWQKDLQKALDDAKAALAKASGEEVSNEARH